jgi:hypothetical protein
MTYYKTYAEAKAEAEEKKSRGIPTKVVRELSYPWYTVVGRDGTTRREMDQTAKPVVRYTTDLTSAEYMRRYLYNI